jgi:lysophospholipase L1-like esterase
MGTRWVDTHDMTTRLASAVLALLLAAGVAACGDDGTPSDATASSAPADDKLRLVVIGDSIPMNSPQDCPGCDGFVQQYAKAAQAALGARVTVTNLAEHTNLTLPGLLEQLPELSDDLADADLLLVGIAHNSFELNADEPCGAPLINDNPDWSAVTPACGKRAAAGFADDFNELFTKVAALREGQPTVLRALNRYDDWRGSDGIPVADTDRAKALVDDWNRVLCAAAVAHGFGCVDLHAAMNGPSGITSAMPLLADGVHPNQDGHDAIAAALVRQGFAPLR